MNLPLPLRLYRWLTRLIAPMSGWLLAGRAKRGKEDPERLSERYGHSSAERPEGTLLWLHGASVGESLILLDLVRRLSAGTGWNFLVTTGTRTSADLMQKELPESARHQYVPIDRPACVRRFLDHWRPDAAVFVESELWPNLLIEMQSRNLPAALVNARMNARSLDNWRKRRSSAKYLLSTFGWIGAADQRTGDGLSAILDQAVALPGNLKLQIGGNSQPSAELSEIRKHLSGRAIWLAASTHEGEDATLLEAAALFRKQHPDALLILAPRHPERADDIAELISSRNESCARRSAGEIPSKTDTIWLADTLGEMDLWYALADKSFIAGSLIDGIGGHNPVESTRAGSAVITGPYVASFDDIYAAYREHEGVLVARDAHDIANALDAETAPLLAGANAALKKLTSGAMEETLAAIHSLIGERTA